MSRGAADDTFICPVCGTEVVVGTAACPECGSDERTGWSDQTIYDGTGIGDPDESFDHDEWERQERQGVTGRAGRQWFWWLVAVLILLALLVGFVWRG